MYLMKSLKNKTLLLGAVVRFLREEKKRGTYKENLKSLKKSREVVEDMSWAELLEEKAQKHPDRTFIQYQESSFTYKEMDDNANRVANYLLKMGAERGKGVALMMSNSPNYLDIFIGSQKIGMYSIPLNTSLRGDSLLYILNHSDAEFIILDEEFLDIYNKIADRVENVKTVIINQSVNGSKSEIPEGMNALAEAYQMTSEKPAGRHEKDDICFILYTSGTTGLPKGVLYRYRRTNVKMLSVLAFALYKKSDILYTCLPLFHGNALFLTVTIAMHIGAKVVLAKKFSASRFWDDIRKYDVTAFNTIGAIIPILMKQPEKKADIQNKVRFTLSAACPVDDWGKFEKRFGIKIYEGYGAVDGGGKSITNMGDAPIGSIGKPPSGTEYRLIDKDGNDVPIGAPGQLIFASRGKKKSVEYFKNEKASNKKLKDGWIYTGDLVKRDNKGYLYFVGRDAEFMRIKGENVSAYEVEHRIQKHPSIVEAAVYAVPSELAEDEIMTCISLVEGHALEERDLVEFLKEDLPKFAIPRFIKKVTEFPRTETQRIIKKELEVLGVTPDTYDSKSNARITESAEGVS